MKRTTLFFAFIIALSLNVTAQSPLPKGVSVHTLDNGIQVLLIENKALPMVGINTVVKVGSAYETFATSGMSHMLEHLLFNGTENMTQRELYDATDLIGGYNNANTSEFYTNFMMVTPAENIYKGMFIQSQMLFHSVLPEKKFEKEKGIVLEEISKSLTQPREQLERNVISVLYKGHALSLPTLGTYETIKHMKRDDVYAFYKNYYKPNNMIVSVIGNFDTKEMLDSLKKYYGSVAPGNTEYPNLYDWATGLNESEFVYGGIYHKFYDGKDIHFQMFYHLLKYAPREFYELTEEKFSEAAEKIKDEINKKIGNVIKDLSVTVRNKHATNYIEFDFTVTEKPSYEDLAEAAKEAIKNVSLALTDTELEEATAEAKTAFLRNIEKPHMFGIYNAEIFAVYGIEGVLEKYTGKGYAEANELLADYFLDDTPTIILQQPQTQNVAEGKSEIVTKVFPSKNDLPTVIARRNSNSHLLAIHYLLGHKSEYEERYGDNAAYIWNAAFGERTKSEKFIKEAAQYGFNFTVNDNPFIPMDDIYLSPDFGYLRVESATENVEGAIDFLNKQMLVFIPTKAEYNAALRAYRMSQMMKHSNQAKSVFEKILNETLYGASEKKSGKTLTYETLLDFGRHYFIPANMIISVVSNRSPEKIAKLFGEFRASVPKDFIASKPKPKTFVDIDKEIKIEKNVNGKRAYLYYGFQKNIEKNERAALKALSLILSDKIVFDIREKQGLAYGMSAGVEVRGNKAMFYIEMGTRPENTDKLIAQFPEKFDEDYLGEITETELKKRINHYLGKMLFRRLSSINQGFYLGRSYYYYGDFNRAEKELDALKKVSVAEVRKVAEKYLNPKNEIFIIVR